MSEIGRVNTNSVSLNRQAGQGNQKPDCGAGNTANHEYKPDKPGEAKVPMPK